MTQVIVLPVYARTRLQLSWICKVGSDGKSKSGRGLSAVVLPFARLPKASPKDGRLGLTTRRDFLQDFDAMRDCANDEAEALDGATGFAGQTDHESFIHDDGEITGEDRVFRDLQGLDAHDFA